MLQLTKHSPRTGFIEGKFRHRVCNAHTHTQKGLKKNPLHRSRALSSSQLFCNHPPFLPNPIHLHQSCPNPPPIRIRICIGVLSTVCSLQMLPGASAHTKCPLPLLCKTPLVELIWGEARNALQAAEVHSPTALHCPPQRCTEK